MGFRSNFITCDISLDLPQWFVEKYPDHYTSVGKDGQKHGFPLIQPWESKFYEDLNETEIFLDIQKVLKEGDRIHEQVVLILLHECEGITRVSITKDSITGREPVLWKDVDRIEHNYCYGCSDNKEASQLTP